jgi:hypothetical protein
VSQNLQKQNKKENMRHKKLLERRKGCYNWKFMEGRNRKKESLNLNS